MVAPVFEELRQAASVRRTRRRLLLAAAAVAIVLAGSMVVAAPWQREPVPPAEQTVQGVDPARVILQDVEFVDSRLAYALASDCPDDLREVRCRHVLYVSDDSGESWTVRSQLPARLGFTSSSPGFEFELVPGIGPDDLTVIVSDPAHSPVTVGTGSMLRSADGGRTWGEPVLVSRSAQPAAPSEPVPLRAVRDSGCSDNSSCPPVLGWLDVENATWVEFPAAPPDLPNSTVPVMAVNPANQGRGVYVVDISVQNPNAVVVDASPDGGQSWVHNEIPVGASDSARELGLVVADDGVVYLSVGTNTVGMAGQLFRTEDGGATWHEVSTGQVLDFRVFTASGGTLLATGIASGEDSRLMSSVDGGGTWDAVDIPPVVGLYLSDSGNVVVATHLEVGATHLSVSNDAGETWTTSTFP